MENTKIEFETFREIGAYNLSNIKQDVPSSVNFLRYKKYKVTIESMPEDKSVYIERLENLLSEAKGHHQRAMINDEIKKLKV